MSWLAQIMEAHKEHPLNADDRVCRAPLRSSHGQTEIGCCRRRWMIETIHCWPWPHGCEEQAKKSNFEWDYAPAGPVHAMVHAPQLPYCALDKSIASTQR